MAAITPTPSTIGTGGLVTLVVTGLTPKDPYVVVWTAKSNAISVGAFTSFGTQSVLVFNDGAFDYYISLHRAGPSPQIIWNAAGVAPGAAVTITADAYALTSPDTSLLDLANQIGQSILTP